jgi:hypothetical protein
MSRAAEALALILKAREEAGKPVPAEEMSALLEEALSIINRGLRNAQVRSGRDGPEVWALCPFHDDHTVGSFSLNTKRAQYHCFVCGAGGGVRSLLYKLVPRQDAETYERVRYLARLLTPEALESVTGVRGGEADLTSPPPAIPETCLPRSELVPDVLLSRGHSRSLLKALGICVDPIHDRIVYPVRDARGTLVGAQTRATRDDQRLRWKWYRQEVLDTLDEDQIRAWGLEEYDPPRNRVLWMEDRVFPWLLQQKPGETAHVVVVEGMGHCLRCMSAGFPTLAMFGTQLGSGQFWKLRGLMEKLRGRGVNPAITVALDGDGPGRRAAVKFALTMSPYADISIAELPPGKDPEDITAPHLQSVIQQSLPLYERNRDPLWGSAIKAELAWKFRRPLQERHQQRQLDRQARQKQHNNPHD